MREILFRGKRVEHGGWVEGSLIKACGLCLIFSDTTKECCVVLNDTVGQFTGMLDKNGKKIFEGDILSTRRDGTVIEKLKGYCGYDSEGYPQRVPGYEGSTEYRYNCKVDCFASVNFSPRHGFYLDGTSTFVDAICNEVVGNIHDNPELLEKKNDP